tara:strand:+ start:4589 stop:5722 length:1134 start_codon:yes stop_codon:yes gene_type:complete
LVDLNLQIKVLHVYKTYFPFTQGGIEEVIKQVCRATTRLGVNNKVICISAHCKKKEIFETPDATVHCYPLSFEIASCGFSWSLWRDFKYLSDWADIIHYQFPWPFADMMALLRQRKSKPYIVSYQSDIVRQYGYYKFYKPLMNVFLSNAATVVATSQKYITSSLVLNNLKKPAVIIPNGIDCEPDPNSYQKEKEEYEKLFGRDFFLFLGVFRYYKGLNYLLEAAKKSGLTIVIAGDGPGADVLHRFVKKNGLTNVHFLGRVSEQQKYALIDNSKAFVLPSSERSEAYGMVLLEAARQGKAMISTELETGTSYINAHNETGLVVSPKNATELATAMEYMAVNDHEVNLMSTSAKRRFKKHFTAEKMGERYLELYQSLL